MIKGGIRLVSSSREKSRVLRAGRWIGFVAFQGIWWGEAEGNFNARLRLFSSTKNYRSLLPTIAGFEGVKLKTHCKRHCSRFRNRYMCLREDIDENIDYSRLGVGGQEPPYIPIRNALKLSRGVI